MDGFTEGLTAHVVSALDKKSGGAPTLMQMHLQKLQRQRAEEAEIEEERQKIERKHLKKEMKRDKKRRKKERKKEKKRRKKYSSSSSDSGSDRDDNIAKQLAAEKEKVAELKRSEQEKRLKVAMKKQQRAEEERRQREAAEAAADRLKLAEWEANEKHEKHVEYCNTFLGTGLGTWEPPDHNFQADPPVPLRYMAKHRSVAWEYPGADGIGIVFARKVDAPPPVINSEGPAVRDESEDEWSADDPFKIAVKGKKQ